MIIASSTGRGAEIGPPHVSKTLGGGWWRLGDTEGVAAAVCTDGGTGAKREGAAWRVGYGGRETMVGTAGAFAAAAANADCIHLGST